MSVKFMQVGNHCLTVMSKCFSNAVI